MSGCEGVPFSNVNAPASPRCFYWGMAANGHLQAAFDEFHQASVELQKHLETAPHSECTDLRERVERLRAHLLELVHSSVGLGSGNKGRNPAAQIDPRSSRVFGASSGENLPYVSAQENTQP